MSKGLDSSSERYSLRIVKLEFRVTFRRRRLWTLPPAGSLKVVGGGDEKPSKEALGLATRPSGHSPRRSNSAIWHHSGRFSAIRYLSTERTSKSLRKLFSNRSIS